MNWLEDDTCPATFASPRPPSTASCAPMTADRSLSAFPDSS